ncbi:hypothetical protein [Thermomonospora catenispora]|uniref:hypothetical protein n=1 Tax=Thermomonospora catenispora TaxID=2493090 RepID=UPI0011209C54|nr:hypothetical protein [Thermomonospora catenispora]TNY34587.1 hypothetical protein EIO00_23005 [Thermomonospora catenispora]
MRIVPATVPGTGTVHHIHTRRGQRLAVLVRDGGAHTLYVYGPCADGGHDPDRPAHSIDLDRDEADRLARLLHDRSVIDRIAALERRLDELASSGRASR